MPTVQGCLNQLLNSSVGPVIDGKEERVWINDRIFEPQITLHSNISCITVAKCLKITENNAFEYLNLDIFHRFCPIKSDLSGNTI